MGSIERDIAGLRAREGGHFWIYDIIHVVLSDTSAPLHASIYMTSHLALQYTRIRSFTLFYRKVEQDICLLYQYIFENKWNWIYNYIPHILAVSLHEFGGKTFDIYLLRRLIHERLTNRIFVRMGTSSFHGKMLQNMLKIQI